MNAYAKSDLIAQLQDIAIYLQLLDENAFKVRAFEKGAAAIESATDSLEDIATGKVKIAGVGEGMKTAIKEFLRDGTVADHTRLAAQVPAGVLDLMKVPGLGPKKAMQLHKELHCSSIAELELCIRAGRIATTKGFGEAMQKKLAEGIALMKQAAGKLRYDEALRLADTVASDVKKSAGKDAEVLYVGQLIRHAETIDEIELALIGGDAAKVIKSLGLKKAKTEIESAQGKLEAGLKITIWFLDRQPDAQTLRFLGASPEVRETIASTPKKFADWEITWLEPEWLKSKREPAKDTYRVSKHGFVKGTLHNHTNSSDGSNTLEEMVAEAERLGFEYIGISEHSQSAYYAGGMKPEKLREQQAKIKALQKKVSIRIFHGIESDILADGALDYDREVLDSLDFIVGSIHSRFKMDTPEMTKRLVNALKHPYITMWGHPTGRLLLGRPPYGLDWNACFDALEENGTAIELNCNPQRFDVDWRHGAELAKRGIRICVNPDAHSVAGLAETRFGEYMVEKAMVSREQVMNLMNVNEMEKFLAERKKRAAKL